jgi:pre-mRNA-processing factor 19
MLESLEIKKAYQAARQELANALYREDAGVRALARIIKERDEARGALAEVRATIGGGQVQGQAGEAQVQEGDVEMGEGAEVEQALPKEVEDVLAETNAA